MKLFTCTDHDIHWPVGGASIVIAKDEKQAKRLLDTQLKKSGLKPNSISSYTLKEISLYNPQAIILRNGNY